MTLLFFKTTEHFLNNLLFLNSSIENLRLFIHDFFGDSHYGSCQIDIFLFQGASCEVGICKDECLNKGECVQVICHFLDIKRVLSRKVPLEHRFTAPPPPLISKINWKLRGFIPLVS